MSGKILAILSEIPNTGIIEESYAFRSIVGLPKDGLIWSLSVSHNGEIVSDL